MVLKFRVVDAILSFFSKKLLVNFESLSLVARLSPEVFPTTDS